MTPDKMPGRDWSFAQWVSYLERVHELATGSTPLTLRERIAASSCLLDPWRVGASLSLRLYVAALWAWVWVWFVFFWIVTVASWGVCFLARPFWTWRELRAVRARLAAQRQAWLDSMKKE